ncbi:UNVERIFIED_ORG: hypothetical protein HNP28_001832 [Comamonas terrigena]
MFDSKAFAQLIELVLSRRLVAAAAKQQVLELFAIVCHACPDHQRRSLAHCGQDGVGACFRFVLLNSPVDGHEHSAWVVLILHLGQVLHIHMYIAWLIRLEGLVLGMGLRWDR